MVRQKIIDALKNSVDSAIPVTASSLSFSPDRKFGDYSTAIALAGAKLLKISPMQLADEISKKISLLAIPEISKIEVVAPGFINFFIADAALRKEVNNILEKENDYGKNDFLSGKKVIVEYSTQNLLKEFHIGHLMSNSIGESIARVIEFAGAEVKRDNYESDIGLNIAQAVWGMMQMKSEMPAENADPVIKGQFLGKAYALGAAKYKEDEGIAETIKNINKTIYQKSDEAIMAVYDIGRRWSLEAFEAIYKKIGTKFDFLFFESEVSSFGKEIVLNNVDNGIFEQSDGAIVFKGEKYGLHTRVFINSQGLPTYEAKDLGLAKVKFERYPYDLAIVATANEQEAYFKVMKKAMELVLPDLAQKTKHIPHGMLRLTTGKMSSRTGNVITAEEFIAEIKTQVGERMKENGTEGSEESKEAISVAAIKYSILRQSPGKDIIFDPEKETSFEGDSGPYLEYSFVRANSILEKAESLDLQIDPRAGSDMPGELERLLMQFPEVVEKALNEYASNGIASYLIELAHVFNSFYAKNKVIDAGSNTGYRLALVKAFHTVMQNGLYLLGIRTVEKM